MRRLYYVSDKMDEQKEERFTSVATVLQGMYLSISSMNDFCLNFVCCRAFLEIMEQ